MSILYTILRPSTKFYSIRLEESRNGIELKCRNGAEIKALVCGGHDKTENRRDFLG